MSTKYTTAAQDAARIRKTLKAAKIANTRQVSIRARSYSLGSSIDVVIHDHTVDIKEVRTIAQSAEHVRRCEYSGEILSGGNRYLSVSYSDAAAEAFAAVNADAIAKLMIFPSGESHGGDVVEIEGRRLCVFKSVQYGGDLELATMDDLSFRRHWLPRREHLNPVTMAKAILSMRAGG